MKRIYYLSLLLTFLFGVTDVKAQSLYYDSESYVFIEQNGLYYTIYKKASSPYANVQRGDYYAYLIAHQGVYEGFDYYTREILPGYRGDVVIPEKVTFKGVDYPVTSISEDAFSGDSLLTSIKLPSTLTSCPNLSGTRIKTIEIPKNVTYVNTWYLDAPELQTITVAKGNTYFASVDGLLTDATGTSLRVVPAGRKGTLVIPEGIKEAQYNTFQYTPYITTVIIPASFNTWSITTLIESNRRINYQVSDTNPSYTMREGMIMNKACDTLFYVPASDAETLTIPAGIKLTACYNDFLAYYFPNLKTVNIPASLKDSKNYNNNNFLKAVCRLPSMENVNINAANPSLASVNGVVMSKTLDTLFYVPSCIAPQNALPATTKYIQTEAFYGNRTIKSLTIPSTVIEIANGAFSYSALETVVIPSSVKKLSDNTFSGCAALKDVTLPNVNALPASFFASCTSLTSFTLPTTIATIGYNAFANCKALEHVGLPESLTTIGSSAFSLCTKLKSIELPEGLLSIDDYAFQNDSLLTNVTLPASLQKLGNGIFRGSPLVQNISVAAGSPYYSDIDGVVFSADKRTLVMCPSERKGAYAIPEGTHNIGQSAFYYCDSLTAITIPNSVDSVRNSAFMSIASVKELDFPYTTRYFDYNCIQGINTLYDPVTYQSYPTLKRLIIRTSEKVDPYNILRYVPKQTEIYVNRNNFTSFQNYNYSSGSSSSSSYGYTIYAIDVPYTIANAVKYLKGFRFTVAENDLMKDTQTSFLGIEVDKRQMQKLADGTYYIDGLKTNTRYNVTLNYTVPKGSTPVTTSMTLNDLPTKSVSIKTKANSTQSTCTITEIEYRSVADTTAVIQKLQLQTMGQTYDLYDPVEHKYLPAPKYFEGLTPGTSYPYNFEITYADGDVVQCSSGFSTKGFNVQSLTFEDPTPTTMRANIVYNEIDAVPDSLLIAFSHTDSWSSKMDTLSAPIRNLVFTGLTPGKTYYRLSYFLKSGNTKNTIYVSNAPTSFTAPQLVVETLEPKIPARGRAIVEARVNVSDDEDHIGFEWRKYNAPESLKSKSAFGVVFGGKAQGEISNLDASNDTYYKVRAFYEDKAGVRYYAKNGPSNDGWITFDPSDLSEFAATVHTNDKPTVTNTTVVLIGMMIQGSEEIIEQGFEYWEILTDESGKQVRRRVRKVQADLEPEIHTVAVTGQRMEVEVTDLIPGTTYGFRAYVKTVKGTIYGEERTFHTNGTRPDGVEAVSDVQPMSVRLSGHRGLLRLHIAADDASKAVVTVTSLRGQQLRRTIARTDGTAVEFDNLPKGVVLVNVRTDNEEQTLKTVIR